MLSENDKYQLRKMVESNNVVDKTEKIRELKHSSLIRDSIKTLLLLKEEQGELLKNNKEEFEKIALSKCNFLFMNYMELYNIILKENMSMNIFTKLLDVLEQIENGELDQHEGSFQVGKHLKEIYIDSKLAETKRLDELYPQPIPVESKQISWKTYKNNIG